MRHFLGADLGGTKTHLMIADETGQVVGFGEAGPSNQQMVGYDGMFAALRGGLQAALESAGLTAADITGAGFGIAGYDWPSETPQMRATIDRLGLQAPYRLVNDALLGLIAGSEAGWGIGLVSGTGCNCWGLDASGQRLGRVTGYGSEMGEAAGASDLVLRAMQRVNYAWIRRGPPTALTEAFIELAGARGADDLLEGYTKGFYPIGPEAAPLVFRVAEAGDAVARSVVRWAGCELGEMVNAVARQLDFVGLAFDIVLVGSMFSAGRALLDPLCETVLQACPGARFLPLDAAPVTGGVLIGMEQGGLPPNAQIRKRLMKNKKRT